MHSRNYQIKALAWDTSFFGVPSCKVSLKGEIQPSDLDRILKDTRIYQFITIQNDNNIGINNRIIGENSNAFLVDINVQFEKKIKIDEDYVVDAAISIINNCEPNQDILRIAEESFVYSRFITDTNLKDGKRVYRSWVQNAFCHKDRLFAVYREGSNICGFILFAVEGEDIILELVAISRQFQGRHIGTKLECAVEKYARENKIYRIKVGTQIDNIAAQNFYVKCGFAHKNNNVIYHLWNKPAPSNKGGIK